MSVTADDCDGEVSAAWCEHHVARLNHRCDACRETIRPGDWYARISYIFEGERYVVKRCARCELIFQHLSALMRGSRCGSRYFPDERPDERLDCGHTYEERWGRPPPEEIARLAFLTADEVQKELMKS